MNKIPNDFKSEYKPQLETLLAEVKEDTKKGFR